MFQEKRSKYIEMIHRTFNNMSANLKALSLFTELLEPEHYEFFREIIGQFYGRFLCLCNETLPEPYKVNFAKRKLNRKYDSNDKIFISYIIKDLVNQAFFLYVLNASLNPAERDILVNKIIEFKNSFDREFIDPETDDIILLDGFPTNQVVEHVYSNLMIHFANALKDTTSLLTFINSRLEQNNLKELLLTNFSEFERFFIGICDDYKTSQHMPDTPDLKTELMTLVDKLTKCLIHSMILNTCGVRRLFSLITIGESRVIDESFNSVKKIIVQVANECNTNIRHSINEVQMSQLEHKTKSKQVAQAPQVRRKRKRGQDVSSHPTEGTRAVKRRKRQVKYQKSITIIDKANSFYPSIGDNAYELLTNNYQTTNTTLVSFRAIYDIRIIIKVIEGIIERHSNTNLKSIEKIHFHKLKTIGDTCYRDRESPWWPIDLKNIVAQLNKIPYKITIQFTEKPSFRSGFNKKDLRKRLKHKLIFSDDFKAANKKKASSPPTSSSSTSSAQTNNSHINSPRGF